MPQNNEPNINPDLSPENSGPDSQKKVTLIAIIAILILVAGAFYFLTTGDQNGTQEPGPEEVAEEQEATGFGTPLFEELEEEPESTLPDDHEPTPLFEELDEQPESTLPDDHEPTPLYEELEE